MRKPIFRQKQALVVLIALCGVLVSRAGVPTDDEKAALADLERFAAGTGIAFSVGTLDRDKETLPKAAVTALAAARSDEAFALAVVREATGRRACLIGKTPIAARYAAVAFLEDYCGVRFFHAGPGGTVVPPKPVCTAPDGLLEVREPRVSFRRLMFRRESVEPNISMDDYRTWMVRRSYQLKPNEASTQVAFDKAVPLSLYKDHPEYFPLIGGKRSLEAAKRNNRRCLTHPDVLRLVSDFIVDHCRHDNAFLLTQYTEFGDWCECPGCRRAGLGDDGVWRVQNFIHRFGTEVSRRALAKMPEAKICAQAYRDWRWPPTAADIVYDPRVAVDYCPICRCYAHPLTAPCNDKYRHDYEGWHRHAPRLGTFGWSSVSGMRYSPIARVFAADLPWLLDHGFDAWLEGCSTPVDKLSTAIGNWRLYYVASRMMWNPKLDIEALLDETDRLYYGVAYEPMHAYQDLRQKVWDETEGHAVANCPCRCFDCLAQPGAEERLLALLAQGEKLAAGDPELQARLAIDRRGLEQYWIAGHREKERKLAARQTLPREDREMPYLRIGAGQRCGRGGRSTEEGLLPEATWAAVPAKAFYVKGKKTPGEATVVRIAADEANWFVRFEAVYDGEPVCKAIERDGEVWKDDAVEFFAKPPRGEYVQVIVNAKGQIYDTLGVGGVDYDYGGEVRQVWRGKTLVTDLRLPLASIAGADKGTDGAWSFRFSRDNPRKNEWSGLGDDWRDAARVESVKVAEIDVPDSWRPHRILGRDLHFCFSAAGQNTRSLAYGGVCPTWDLDIFREGGVQYEGFKRLGLRGRRHKYSEYARPATPEEGKLDYSFEDFFGEVPLKSFQEPLDPSKIVTVILHSSRPAFLGHEDVRPDTASYWAWRNRRPNFVCASACDELDSEMDAYCYHVKDCPDAKLREDLLRRFPLPKDRWEWVALTKKLYEAEQRYFFGETNIWPLCSSCFTLSPIQANNGAAGLYYESTGQEFARWQVAGAYLRGAARQWNIPYGWYTAHFCGGFRRNDLKTFRNYDNFWCPELMPWFKSREAEVNGGTGRTLLSRQNFYGWIIGSSIIQVEDWQRLVVKAGGPDGKTRVPHESALDMQALYDLSKRTDRGAVYTPCAILSPLTELYGPAGTRLWLFRDNEDFYSMDAFIQTLVPMKSPDIYQRELHKLGDVGCLFNSPFGEFYDVVVPDSAQPSDVFAKALAPYKCAFLVGTYRKGGLDLPALESFVHNGGRLYVSAERVLEGIVPKSLTGVAFSTNTVASADAFRGEDGATVSLGDGYLWHAGTPDADVTPWLKDANGTVVAYRRKLGKGEVVTICARRFAPCRYFGLRGESQQIPKITDYVSGRHTFALVKYLLEREQRLTMPVTVEGDVQWGVNKCGVRRAKDEQGKGTNVLSSPSSSNFASSHWLVWLINNKGVTKFVGEPEEYDPSQTAHVRVTDKATGRVQVVDVRPGEWKLLPLCVRPGRHSTMAGGSGEML